MKTKKPKLRKPRAKPQKPHKSKRDYKRKPKTVRDKEFSVACRMYAENFGW